MHALKWIVTGTSLLTVVYLLGPRVSANVDLSPIQLPDDLDTWLDASEASFGDIVPGTEKHILWNDSVGVRTALSFVYIHGFTATRQEVAPLVDSLAARFGANVYFTRLTGHGRGWEAMRDASTAAWTRDVREAVAVGARIGERVVLVGTSQGGALSAWVAAQAEVQPSLAALVLLSPNLGPRMPGSELLDGPWALQLLRLFLGERHEWEAENELQERYWTTSSAIEGLPVMMASVGLTRAVADVPIPFPVQVLVSTEDRVVDVDLIREWFEDLPAATKELVEYGETADGGNHVIAGDILDPEGTRRVLERVTEFLIHTDSGSLDEVTDSMDTGETR